LGAPLLWTDFASDGECALALDGEGRLLRFETPRVDGPNHHQATARVLNDAHWTRCVVADSAMVAVGGGADGVVGRIDLISNEIVSESRGWVQGVRDLAIRPDGSKVAIVDGIGRLGLWDGGSDVARRLPGVEQQIQRVCFDPSGRLLAAGDALGQVLIWDTTTLELIHRLAANWSADSGERHPVVDLAFNPEGTSVHAACAPWWTLSWELDSKDESLVGEKRMALLWMEALPDELGVLTCGSGVGTISIGHSERLSRPVTQHTDSITCLQAKHGSKIASTGSKDGSVLIWDVESGETLARYAQHRGTVEHIAFAPDPDDERILTAGADGTLALWLVNPTRLAESVAPYGLSQRLRDRFDSWGMAPESR
ncbi:MAG: WD40 repeat domain-containing protein, partial [Planctomycetes bacterium]|nr:WD40 repeat domain-containing protein [Planctomycetota bacterium]